MKARSSAAALRSACLAGCALLLAAAQSPTPAQQDGAPNQRAVSQELKQLYEDDQRDQKELIWCESSGAERQKCLGH